MHTFPDYHPPDDAAVTRFVLEHPFAIAATSQAGAPIATHLPIVPPTGATIETLEGATLWGHMGRANRHWRRMLEQPEVLLMHASSHAYISASLYEKTPSVPTVDYAAVHLEGTVRIVTDDDLALEIVTQTVRHCETLRHEALGFDEWDYHPSLDVFRRILGGIVAFEVEVTAVQAVFKLSQNQPEDARERIKAEERSRACPHADVADLMGQFDHGFTPGGHYPPPEEPSTGDIS